MSKQKYIVVGSIVGKRRGQVVELTEEQAKSGIWAGRVQKATVVSVVDPAKEQELQTKLDSEAARADKAEAEAKALADQLAEAQARADKAEAELKDRDKAQLVIATPAAASSKK